MRPRLVIVLLPLASCLSACALAARRTEPPIRPWQKVRVTAPAAGLDRKRETFLAVRADSLVLVRVESRGQFAGYRMADTIPWTVPLDAVTRLEVRTRISWSGLVGSLGGLTAGWVIVRQLDCGGLDRMGECFAQGLFIPLGCGAVGGLLGEALVPGAQWEQVPVSSLRSGLAPLTAGHLARPD